MSEERVLSEKDIDQAWVLAMGVDRFEWYLMAIARQLGIVYSAPFALETQINALARLWRSERGPFAGKDPDGQWQAARDALARWAKDKHVCLEVGKEGQGDG